MQFEKRRVSLAAFLAKFQLLKNKEISNFPFGLMMQRNKHKSRKVDFTDVNYDLKIMSQKEALRKHLPINSSVLKSLSKCKFVDGIYNFKMVTKVNLDLKPRHNFRKHSGSTYLLTYLLMAFTILKW